MSFELWLAIAGTALSVVGIPLAIVLSRHTRKRPTIRVKSQFDTLMSSDHGIARALEIAYGGREIERVCRTNVAFWNHKGDTIQGTDIVEHDAFRVQVPEDDVVLQVRKLSVSRDQCKISGDIDASNPTRVLLTFDFIDAGDGAVFEILHITPTAAEVVGTVRGASLASTGYADLSPPALDMVAIQDGPKRILAMLKAGGRARNYARLGLIMLAGGVAVLGSTIKSAISDGVFRRPTFIYAHNYHLETLEGQADFAKEVTKRGLVLSPISSWTAMAFGLLFALVTIYAARKTFRAVIPRSIVGVRYFEKKTPTAGD